MVERGVNEACFIFDDLSLMPKHCCWRGTCEELPLNKATVCVISAKVLVPTRVTILGRLQRLGPYLSAQNQTLHIYSCIWFSVKGASYDHMSRAQQCFC